MDSGVSKLQIIRWFDPELLEHFPDPLFFLRRIQSRFFRILRPKQHVAIIALRHRHEFAQLLFASPLSFKIASWTRSRSRSYDSTP